MLKIAIYLKHDQFNGVKLQIDLIGVNFASPTMQGDVNGWMVGPTPVLEVVWILSFLN